MALDCATEVETADYQLLVLCAVCELRPPEEGGTICGWCIAQAPEPNYFHEATP